jgi:hypothetical protein
VGRREEQEDDEPMRAARSGLRPGPAGVDPNRRRAERHGWDGPLRVQRTPAGLRRREIPARNQR